MSIMSFILGMFVVLMADALSEWLYAKADEIREDTERRRAERVRMELHDDAD